MSAATKKPTTDTLTGRRLGRYEILLKLAQGGMASVYVGRSVGVAGFSRLVAIKLLHPHLAHEDEFVSMFLDEARIAAAIRHPNVVATHDISDAEELGYYLVMDYIEGGHLGALFTASAKNGVKPLPVPLVLRIFLDILDGLGFAHELTDEAGTEAHVVHRDVSPQNILIGTDGISRITDFGIAHAERRLTQTRSGDFKGKIAYVSPEQALGKELDGRSDLFSLAIVFFEMLVGRRLQKTGSDLETLKGIVGLETPRISDERPELEPFDEVLRAALATDRDQRYASAAEMSAGIEAAAKKAGITPATRKEVAAFTREQLGPSLERVRDRAAAAMRDLGPLELTPSGTRELPPPRAEPETDAGTPIAVEVEAEAPVSDGSRRWLWFTVAGVVLLLGALGFVLSQREADPPPAAHARPPTEVGAEVPDAPRPETAETAATDTSSETEAAPVEAAPVEAAPEQPRARPRPRPRRRPRPAAVLETPPDPTPPPPDPLADNPYRRAQ